MRNRVVWALGWGVAICAPLAAVRVPPGQGVAFEQITFALPGIPSSEVGPSRWARAVANPAQLQTLAGFSHGYINILSGQGWVVQNWLVDRTEALIRPLWQPAIPPDTYYFQLLPSETRQIVSTFPFHVEFTSAPVLATNQIPNQQFTPHPVTSHLWNAQGAGAREATAPGAPPVPGQVVFDSQGETFAHTLPYSVNVEAALNQCVPMSLANSLQYLEDRYKLSVPHNHQAGLKGDTTLVGRLDTFLDRFAPSRTNGGGVWFTTMLNGKFRYLSTNNLASSLVHRHQGRGYGAEGSQLPDGNYTAEGATSIDDGGRVTWEWVCGQIKAGEDVELIFTYDDAAGNPIGGHAVRIIGCGKNLGRPWLKYLHDSAQGNDGLGLETPTVYVSDTDLDGMLNFGSAGREVRFALSESMTEAAKRASPAPPQILGERFVNAASFVGKALARGTLGTVFGLFPDLATTSRLAEGAVRVLVNGREAPVFFANENQINFQVPVEMEAGAASAAVIVNSRPSELVTFTVDAVAPGIFLLDPSIAGSGRGVIQNQDFSLNLPSNPAPPGGAIVVYMTGLGETNPVVATGQPAPFDPLARVTAAVSATIGDRTAEVLFAGLTPAFTGLYQVNLRVPASARGDHFLVVRAGGVDSNPVRVAVGGN